MNNNSLLHKLDNAALKKKTYFQGSYSRYKVKASSNLTKKKYVTSFIARMPLK